MRAALLALMAIGTVAMIDATPAEARDYPFCIKGAEYLSANGDCSFDTYAQCQATASGRLAYCDANPFYRSHEIPRQESRRPYPRTRPRY